MRYDLSLLSMMLKRMHDIGVQNSYRKASDHARETLISLLMHHPLADLMFTNLALCWIMAAEAEATEKASSDRPSSPLTLYTEANLLRRSSAPLPF